MAHQTCPNKKRGLVRAVRSDIAPQPIQTS